MAKTLNTTVAVGGVWYRAGARVGDQIPEDVAEKITNPKVWSYDDADEGPEEEERKSTTGAQLVARVAVGGQWYGPGDDVPDDVARRITNPKVWEGGKLPFAEEKPAKADAAAAKPADEPAAQAEAQTSDADTAAEDTDAAGESRPARRGRRA